MRNAKFYLQDNKGSKVVFQRKSSSFTLIKRRMCIINKQSKFQNYSYCSGDQQHRSTKSVEVDITPKGTKLIIGKNVYVDGKKINES